MRRRRLPGAATAIVAAICGILAIFATIAWMQDSSYGVVAVALWVVTVVALLLPRKGART
jgi:type III secretory pathway component EscS